MRLYGSITKVDRGDTGVLIVRGIASSETVDSDGEVVSAGAMKEALPGFMKGGSGPLREMHQPIAAGAVIKAEVQDDGSTVIEAKVVDRQAITKIDEGVLKGFSIGGAALARDPKNRKRIVKLHLTEVSLVDRPANGDCLFKLWRPDADEPSPLPSLSEVEAMSEEDRTLLLTKAALARPHRPAPPKPPAIPTIAEAQAMSDEERTLLLTKAALARPV